MANPYTFETINPMDVALRGFQGIQTLRQNERQSALLQAQQQAMQAQVRKAEQEMAEAQRFQTDMARLYRQFETGNVRPEAVLSVIAANPQLSEPIQKLMASQTEQERIANFQTANDLYTAAEIGDAPRFARLIDDMIAAAENEGDADGAQVARGIKQTFERDPASAKTTLAMQMAYIDPDRFKKQIEAIQTYTGPSAKEPENVRSARAYAATFGPEGSPEYTTAFREALVRPPAPAAVVNVGGPGGLQLTPGQEAVDKKFADTYLSWIDGGGAATASRIATLNSAVERLSSGQPLTGPIVGITPEFAEAWVNPQATALRQDVQSAVVEGLRQALGAQFTEKEGTRILNLAFDRSLPPAENKKRVQRLISATQAALDAKANAVAYFEDKGTMQGYRYRAPSVSDFEAAIRGEGPLAKQARPSAGRNFRAMNDDALLRLDPQRLSQSDLQEYFKELDRRGFE